MQKGDIESLLRIWLQVCSIVQFDSKCGFDFWQQSERGHTFLTKLVGKSICWKCLDSNFNIFDERLVDVVDPFRGGLKNEIALSFLQQQRKIRYNSIGLPNFSKKKRNISPLFLRFYRQTKKNIVCRMTQLFINLALKAKFTSNVFLNMTVMLYRVIRIYVPCQTKSYSQNDNSTLRLKKWQLKKISK